MKKDLKNGVEQTERIIADLSEKIRSGELPQGAKLDSEANLMQQYQANVYCVRKALRSLKECGLLYSVPKFGVFVGNQGKKKEKHDLPLNPMALSQLRLKMISHLPAQRKLWDFAIKAWNQQDKTTHLELSYPDDPDDIPYDIYEVSSCNYPQNIKNHDIVNILKYLPGLFEIPPADISPYDIPFHYTTAILIYNDQLMKKIGIPAPSYTNFKEQREYLRDAFRKIEAGGMFYPGISQNFAFIFGKNVQQEMLQDLLAETTDIATFTEKYGPVFDEVRDYIHVVQFDYLNDPETAKINFVLGKTPFYLGLSYEFADLKQEVKTFHVSGAMMYNMDDRFNSIQVAFSLSKKTGNIVAAISALNHLQSNPVQEKIASGGLLPLKAEQYKKLPYSLIIPQEKMETQPLFRTELETYIMDRIISSTLWGYVTTDTEKREDLFRKIFTVARAYIQINQEDNNNQL